jgi:hypothetical protein
MPDFDTVTTGGEELSLDEAAAAYAKVSSSEADTGQSEDDEYSEAEQTDEELQTSEEGSEDANGEDDPEGQSEDEEDAEPETERGRYVAHNGRVRLPDGSESTIADLIAGNMKERDYRQKTMAHSEAVKAFESQSTAIKAKEQQLDQRLEFNAALIRSIVGEAPDMTLFDTDPREYLRQKEAREGWIAHLTAIEQQLQQNSQYRQAEQQQSLKERADSEWNHLVTKVPALADETKAKAFIADVNKYGGEFYGFTGQDLAALNTDHRLALAMRDAISWRKLQASKPKVQQKVEGKPPVQRGGKRLSPTEQRGRTASDAMTRLKQSGSERDAVAAYLATQNKG